MTLYAIGDIQGCYDELRRLLDTISFDPDRDQLWFAGDLVNRGPKSLKTLRYIKSLGNAAITVLGNHDLHLLAVACLQRKTRAKDSLIPILEAADKDDLLFWLRHQPLFHYNDDYCILHAGIPPQWDFNTTRNMAKKVEKVLQSADYVDFFKHMYGNQPDIWSKHLSGTHQLRFIVNCFTRMRYCDSNGRLDFSNNGPLGSQAENLLPWFAVPKRKSAKMRIIFGHWSTLGYFEGNNCYGIDTGCLWGGQLTALRLDKQPKRISIDCPGYKKPGKK